MSVDILTHQTEGFRAWQPPAMLQGCSAVCPRCRHEFTCCRPAPCCCQSAAAAAGGATSRRSLHALSGGGMVTSLAPGGAVGSPCHSPQVSPSAPLAFVIPPAYPLAPPVAAAVAKPEVELQRLADTVRALRLSGWYYEGISYQKIHELLKDTKVGTFLVRDSMDPRFLFSLSVQTERGPTSVRLFYADGSFRLDAQPHLRSVMPLFPCVVELVQHYVAQSRRKRNDALVWVDPRGKWYSSIVLDEPLRRQEAPLTLKHLSRLAVNRTLQPKTRTRIAELELPVSLKAYLAEYPYWV